MQIFSQKHNQLAFQLFILSFFIVFALFVWQGNKGFNLGDEGFLWYGAQQVMLGDVPIRDFMAYDPGRYYWSAGVMKLLGDNGIMQLRIAIAIFQALGLFVSLLLIAQTIKPRSKEQYLFILLSAIILVIWMHPRHKIFDISLSIFLVGSLAFLIQNPNLKRYFYSGICLGLVAVFGRNHGVYGAFASILAIFWLHLNSNNGPGIFKSSAYWTTGILIGFAPILIMSIVLPGFASAFLNSILFLFEVKTTNLALPIPWPWQVNFSSLSIGSSIRNVLIGLFFVAILAFSFISIIWLIWQKTQNKNVAYTFVGASFLALPYAHYAYSRADINHLAQSIFPFLIASLILLSQQKNNLKWPLTTTLCLISFWVMHIFHPGWECRNKHCVPVEVSDSNLQVNKNIASNINLIRQTVQSYAPDRQNFIVTPYWPGAFSLLERKSPLWEIYALFPRSKKFELEEIDRLKKANPTFALIIDLPTDGRNELRYRNTHPLTHQYILDNFERLPHTVESNFQIYKPNKILTQ